MSIPNPPSRRSSTTPSFPQGKSNDWAPPTLSRQASLVRRRNQTQSPSSTQNDEEVSGIHPLAGSNDWDDDAESDISRPTLRRLTSETERQVAESSRSASEAGSNRGSLDVLRMSTVEEESREVEVLIHHVKPTESLAGIALLYGIDVAMLRKINKLWTSDSVHLRTHLYVPIEACKWNKASETFVRGPGAGQITLVPKHTGSRKGKEPVREQQSPLLVDTSQPQEPQTQSHNGSAGPSQGIQYDQSEILADWDGIPSPSAFLPSTNMAYDRSSIDSIRPNLTEIEDQAANSRIVDVVRIPNSQLRFFPTQKPPDTAAGHLNSRRSLEMDMQRGTIERKLVRSTSLSMSLSSRSSGPMIKNDLRTLPPPLRHEVPSLPSPSPKKDKMVRIRPPSIRSSSSSSTLADRLTSFFHIPPPPELNHQSHTQRGSIDSTGSAIQNSRSASSASPSVTKDPDVLLEMKPRGKSGVRINSKTTLSSKKID